MLMGNLGSWAFIIGLIIAVILAVIPGLEGGILTTILVIVGIIVGLLNVTDKEINDFLVASIALIASGLAGDFLSAVPVVGSFLQNIVNNFVILVAPAAIIVAVKSIIGLAKD